MSTRKKDQRTQVDPEVDNEVRLQGRVSAAPEVRELPSGDELVLVRVVVPRRTVRARTDGRRSPSVDVIDCAAWDARPRRTVASWEEGDEVTVVGALRRRFFRAGGQTASRVEVEVSSARRLRRSASG